jgi:TPR repeat protein
MKKISIILVFTFIVSFIAESNTKIDVNENIYSSTLTEKYIKELRLIWSNLYQKQLKIHNKEFENLLIIENYADQTIDKELYYALGVVYMNIPNSVKALKWMTLAANNNHTPALHNIGWWYDHGFGHIKEDNDKALEYYNKAFWKLGLARSGGRLAEIYLNGDGLKKNKKYAKKIYLKIIKDKENLFIEEYDVILAEYKLGHIFSYSIPEEQDLDKSLLYFISAANKGHEQSMVEAGRLFRQKFRQTSSEKYNKYAEKMYVLAIEKGNTDAMVYLSTMYYEKYAKGIKVKINHYKHLSWMYAAYKIGIKNKDLIDNVTLFVNTKIENDEELLTLLNKQTDDCIKKNFKDCF